MTVGRLTSELKTGDVVCTHGMRVRLGERREHTDPNTYGGRFHSFDGTVLNLADVAEMEIVPLGWLKTQKFVDGQGWVTDREDQWAIQGNDLVTWAVESCPCGYPGTAAECAAAAQAEVLAELDKS